MQLQIPDQVGNDKAAKKLTSKEVGADVLIGPFGERALQINDVR